MQWNHLPFLWRLEDASNSGERKGCVSEARQQFWPALPNLRQETETHCFAHLSGTNFLGSSGPHRSGSMCTASRFISIWVPAGIVYPPTWHVSWQVLVDALHEKGKKRNKIKFWRTFVFCLLFIRSKVFETHGWQDQEANTGQATYIWATVCSLRSSLMNMSMYCILCTVT